MWWLFQAALAAPPIVDPVTDRAEVLSEAEEQALDAELRALRDETGVQGAILTVRNIPYGETIETFSLQVAEAWGGGTEGRDDGVLLVLAVGDRQSRLEVGYGLEGAITDGEAGAILDDMVPALRLEDYGAALSGAVGAIAEEVADLRPGQPIPLRYRALGTVLRALPTGPWLTGLAALLGGVYASMFGWGWWGVGPPRELARWLHVRWTPFVRVGAALWLSWMVLAALLLSWGAAARILAGALAGAACWGPNGAAHTRLKLGLGVVTALVLTGLATLLGVKEHGDEEPLAWILLALAAPMPVAFLALEHTGSGGSSSSSSSSSSSTSSSSSSSSSSSGGDWGGGGGGFGGGGASGSW